MSKIFFYHINKCAGTSLLSYFMGISNVNKISRLELHQKYSYKSLNSNVINEVFRAEFIHDPIGVIDWKSIFGNGFNVLWLRDPVERLISQIKMISRWTDLEVVNSSHSNYQLRELARMGVEAFLTSNLFEAHQNRFNGITSYLQLNDPRARALWHSSHLIGASSLNKVAMEIAFDNIEKMDFIGFVDSFEDDFKCMRSLLGNSYSERMARLNSYSNSFDVLQLSTSEIELLNDAVHIDRQVYDYAKKISIERKSSLVYSEAFMSANVNQIKKIIGPTESVTLYAGDSSFIDGWHPCELNSNNYSRWSFLGSRSLISAHIEKNRDLYFRIRVVDVANISYLNNLKIYFDDYCVNYCVHLLPNNNLILDGIVLTDFFLKSNDEILWINFDFGFILPSNNFSDGRQLAICVAEIEIGPSEKYLNCHYGYFSRII